MSSCRKRFSILYPVALLVCLGAGCSSETASESADVELPDWLTEKESQESSQNVQLASHVESASLGLNLKPGDQFPLRKIVQQELIQEAPTGRPTRNYSRLELMMAISVLEKQTDRIKLGVRYDRVKYQHEVADERVEFDSNHPENIQALGVVAYRDMVHDGFAFWIGADNQIVEVEGLAEFINRCLRNVPESHRKNVVLGIEAGSGDSGIANFVDNTIGLLPYGRRTSPGDAWERQQRIARPFPMHVSNVYTLKELTRDFAVIDVRGTITPSTTLSAVDQGSGVKVTVNGGSTLGSCTIYRDTGLPKESRIDRIVDMTVTMENSISFRQTKRITTTIESFPSSSSEPHILQASGPAERGHIQRVSAEQVIRDQ